MERTVAPKPESVGTQPDVAASPPPRRWGEDFTLAVLQSGTDVLCWAIAFAYCGFGVGLVPPWTSPSMTPRFAGAAALFLVALVTVYSSADLYSPVRNILDIFRVRDLIRGGLHALLFTAGTFYVFGWDPGLRTSLLWGAVGSVTLVIYKRRIISAWLERRHERGVGCRRVLLVGPPKRVQRLAEILLEHSWAGFVPADKVDDGGTGGVKRSREAGDFEQGFEEIWHVDDGLEGSLIPEFMFVKGKHIRQAVAGFSVSEEMVVGGYRVARLGEGPNPFPGFKSISRVVLNSLAAGVVLALSSPVFALVAIAIKLDSPGPVFFAQNRVGRGGRTFRMLKFRTMYADTSAYANKPRGAGDIRVTRVGRLLRRVGLDELPQVINVLKGEMALVGPRPEMSYKVDFSDPYEMERLSVAPGITGLWQLSASRSRSIKENIQFDLCYIQTRSFLLDILIILRTIVEILKGFVGRSVFDF